MGSTKSRCAADRAPVHEDASRRGRPDLGHEELRVLDVAQRRSLARQTRSIVELGSGRSTQYLADYAMKADVPFVSVEQSRAWARRIESALTLGLVSGHFVHYVPIGSERWYDVGRLDALVRFPCDCLVVDGPVGAQEGLGRANRDGAVAREWLSRVALHSRLIVVDDVHREENLQLFRLLSDRAGGLERRFLAYQPSRGSANLAAFGIESTLAARLDDASLAIGIAATR